MPGAGNLGNHPGQVKSWVWRTFNQLTKQEELHSKYVSVYPHINVTLGVLQGNFSLQQTQIVTENYNQSKCKVVEPNYRDRSIKSLSHLWLKESCGRGTRQSVKSRGSASLL